MRVAHISVIKKGKVGVFNKIKEYAESSYENKLGIDFFWICNEFVFEETKFLNIKEVKSKNLITFRIQSVSFINKIVNDYDKVVLRYPYVDFIYLFGIQNKRKIFLEHHSKEVDVLKTNKNYLWLIESVFGGYFIKKFAGVIGVTKEIAEYEQKRSNINKALVVTNGYKFNCENLQDNRNEQEIISFIFVASEFKEWHGLDILIDAVTKYDGINDFKVFVVGKVLNKVEHPKIVYYDYLSQSELKELYKTTQIGFGSLNLIQKRLIEGADLKNREYLSHGICVVQKHIDSGLPENFEYLLKVDNLNFDDIIQWYTNLNPNKSEVCKKSAKYLDSKVVLKKLINEI